MRIIAAETRINRLKHDLKGKIANRNEDHKIYLHKMFRSIVCADKEPSQLSDSSKMFDNLLQDST